MTRCEASLLWSIHDIALNVLAEAVSCCESLDQGRVRDRSERVFIVITRRWKACHDGYTFQAVPPKVRC